MWQFPKCLAAAISCAILVTAVGCPASPKASGPKTDETPKASVSKPETEQKDVKKEEKQEPKKETKDEVKPEVKQEAKEKPADNKLNVTKEPFGKTPEGEEVELYTLTNRNGLRVKIMTYGATITAVETPDNKGKVENITLGFDTLADYIKGCPYFGATVGRYANRIANGEFKLDGKTYTLAKNNDKNHLHGGKQGFDKRVWKAVPGQNADACWVEFSLVSPDNEEGYPGKVNARVTYSLTNENELKMDYEADTDKPTVVNLTNHAYWNLAGAGNVLDHEIAVFADRYLPVDAGLIPTGELKAVKDTPMDFNTAPKTIGSRIADVPGGYDHCYVLVAKKEPMALAAKVVEPKSGRVMEIWTTQPAVQFYTGNFLDGTLKSGNRTYEKNAGFCIETQHYPDSPNKPEFPTTVLKPGEKYKQSTVHKFSAK